MTEDPFDSSSPAPPRVWNDKSEIHVPGAGTMGMVLLLASLSMIFAGTIVLFILFRFVGGQWKESVVAIPHSLWISTIVIIISSVTMQRGYRAIQRDQEKSLAHMLMATLVLGAAFLVLQGVNWYEVYAQIVAHNATHNFSIAFFYLFTALHAVHVLGGLIPMAITLAKARRGVYSRNFHPGVRYTTIYWHFLAVMWVVLFGLLYFT